jgi:hypothetical protein
MRFVFDVPEEDASGGAVRLVRPEDAGSLIHDLSGLLKRVKNCPFCRAELLAAGDERRKLHVAVKRLWAHLEELEQEACGD